MLQQGQNTREFIEDQFAEGPVSSGTVMPERFSTGNPEQDNIQTRIQNIRAQNLQDLVSGNVSPKQAAALGGRLKSGLIYKNSPRLASLHADRLTAAMIGKGAAEFGPEYTKVMQNLQLGADFEEVLKDPSTPTVRIGGEDIDRATIERPAAFGKTAKKLDERIQEQKDYRGKVKLEAMGEKLSAKNNMESIVKRGQTLKSLQGLLEADGNTAGVERVNDELDKLRGQYRFQEGEVKRAEKRISGITRKTDENIRNLSAPRTLQNFEGTGYKVDVQQRDDLTTGGFNKLDPQVEVKIVPDIERKQDTKREIDRGGFDMPEVEETGKLGGFSLQQPDERRRIIGTKTSKQGIEYPVYSGLKITGDMPAGMKPTGITGDIQQIYKTGDPTTINQRIDEFKKKLGIRAAGGLTIEDIQDL